MSILKNNFKIGDIVIIKNLFKNMSFYTDKPLKIIDFSENKKIAYVDYYFNNDENDNFIHIDLIEKYNRCEKLKRLLNDKLFNFKIGDIVIIKNKYKDTLWYTDKPLKIIGFDYKYELLKVNYHFYNDNLIYYKHVEKHNT